MRRPFNGAVNITTEYGASQPGTRRGYHTGVDYAMPVGSEIVAPENGTVLQNGDGTAPSDGRGYFIVFKGDSGTYHQLFHLKQMGKVGGRAAEGQVIGYSGNTGRTTGPHLHWETTSRNDRTSDFAPSKWLFKDQPVYQPPVAKPVTQYVRLFGDYRTLRTSPGGAQKARIAPNNYPERYLDYAILERSGNDWVKIKTQMYNEGWIWVGADVASITQYYNA